MEKWKKKVWKWKKQWKKWKKKEWKKKVWSKSSSGRFFPFFCLVWLPSTCLWCSSTSTCCHTASRVPSSWSSPRSRQSRRTTARPAGGPTSSTSTTFTPRWRRSSAWTGPGFCECGIVFWFRSFVYRVATCCCVCRALDMQLFIIAPILVILLYK